MGGVRRFARWLALPVAGLMLLYYPLGAWWIETIDDDPTFSASTPPGNASRTAAVMAALIEREVDAHRWTANEPFFFPGFILDNMPHYQQGIVGALARVAVELVDQIGRTRGSSQADADLEKAAGLLKYSGTVWVFDLSTSMMPTSSSEVQYRAARKALLAYNVRLAEGKAVFERRADNLLNTLERIAADLGSASAQIEAAMREGAERWIDTRADDVFYGTKGRAHAYHLMLRELGRDFETVLKEKELGGAWGQMLDSLKAAAGLRPLVVCNAAVDGLLLPNHLAAQGFHLLRARTQVKEVANILLK